MILQTRLLFKVKNKNVYIFMLMYQELLILFRLLQLDLRTFSNNYRYNGNDRKAEFTLPCAYHKYFTIKDAH